MLNEIILADKEKPLLISTNMAAIQNSYRTVRSSCKELFITFSNFSASETMLSINLGLLLKFLARMADAISALPHH